MLHTPRCAVAYWGCVCPWQDLLHIYVSLAGPGMCMYVSLTGPSCTPHLRNHPPTLRQHTLHPPWLLPAHLVWALTQDIFWFQIPVCNPWGQKSQ